MDEVEISLIFKDFVELDDVGVVEFFKDLNFGLECLWVFDMFFGNDLDDTVFKRGLNHPSEVDNTVGASAQGLG